MSTLPPVPVTTNVALISKLSPGFIVPPSPPSERFIYAFEKSICKSVTHMLKVVPEGPVPARFEDVTRIK